MERLIMCLFKYIIQQFYLISVDLPQCKHGLKSNLNQHNSDVNTIILSRLTLLEIFNILEKIQKQNVY